MAPATLSPTGVEGSTTWMLAGAAAKAVATVGTCAAVGAYARRQGFLDKKTQKNLDKLIAEVFLPCLILGKVTPNMTPTELTELWPLLAMCPCVVLFGLVSGALVSRCLARYWPGAFPKYRGLIMVALAFPNSFSVPLTLLLAVGDHPALLRNGTLVGKALKERIALHFLMSYALWVLARWSIGYPVLSGALSFKEWKAKALNTPVKACVAATILGLVWNTLNELAPLHFSLNSGFITPVVVAVDYSGRCTVPMILFALGARLDEAIQEVRKPWSQPELAAAQQSGDAQPGAQTADVALPAEVIGLKAQVEMEAPGSAEGLAAEEDCALPLITYPIVLFLRQVAGPCFSALVACGVLRRLCGVNDPVVLMVAMLQGSGPPMINLSVMAGISGKAEIETSKLLLVTYGASVLTWTASISCFLWLLG